MKTNHKRVLLLSAVYLGLALAAYNSDRLFSSLRNTSTSVTQIPSPSQSLQARILELTNQQRAREGAPPLSPEPRLEAAADSHSREMIELNYFEHESPNPKLRNPWDRVDLTGFTPRSVGENIYEAEGYPVAEIPAACVNSWVESPEHHKNMVNPNYSYAGVGVARSGHLYRITMVYSSR